MESNKFESYAEGDSEFTKLTKGGPDGAKSDPSGDGMESNELATGAEGDPDEIGNETTDGTECDPDKAELDNEETKPFFQSIHDNSTSECFYPILKSLGISIDLSIPDNHEYVKKMLGELVSLQLNFHTSMDSRKKSKCTAARKNTVKFYMRDNFTTSHTAVVRPHKSESAFVRYHGQNPYLQEVINVGRVDTVDRETNDNYCASQLVQEVVRGGRIQGAVKKNIITNDCVTQRRQEIFF